MGLTSTAGKNKLFVSEQDSGRLLQIPFCSPSLCRSSPAPKVGGKSARGEHDRGCAPSAFLVGEPVMQGRNRSQAQSSQLQEKLGELLGSAQGNEETLRVWGSWCLNILQKPGNAVGPQS